MKTSLVVIGTATVLWIACAKGPARSSPNVKTSLGTLTDVERRVSEDPSNPEISLQSGEVAYLLTFKGDIAIANYEKGWEKRVPLVDAGGREFIPVTSGTPDANGKLSQEKWMMSGAMTGSGGRWVFEGSATVPDGVMVVAYVVPADAEGLKLKDGASMHPLGID